MKKLIKRILPFALVVVMCLCMAAPAFADTNMASYMYDNFTLRESGHYCGCVGIIQSYLLAHNEDTESAIRNSGGLDWYFGSGTYSATIAMQRDVGLTPDGVVGRYTWQYIGSAIFAESQGTSKWFCHYRGNEADYDVLYVSGLGSSGSISSSTQWYVYKGSSLTRAYPLEHN